MTNITETSDIFLAIMKVNHIVLGNSYCCNYAYNISFLELFWNQTLILQNMVITLKFINLCNTATITHVMTKLHINYLICSCTSYRLLLLRLYYSLNMYTDLELH